jgi:CRISPR/Cas system CSM-associated protein Csm3 (group 7 of RAMP superfamily)
MFDTLKTLKNKARAEFVLSADSPVLVAAKYAGDLDPTVVDAQFLMGSNGGEDCCVIPGSTLKGVFRSFFEINDGYKSLDTASLFGTLKGADERAHKGRISFHDAYAVGEVRMVARASTALNPSSQSAKSGSLNNVLAVEKGDFAAGFTVVNYTDEEILCLTEALELLNEGFIRIGGRKSRGFGKMTVKSFRLTTIDGFNPDLTEKEGYSSDSLAEAAEHYREARNGRL